MSNTSNDYAIKGISSVGEQLYLNEETADFHFICKSADGKDERIPVHKLLLGSVSDVFRAMFSDSWKDKVDVVITDATVAEFEEFLQFFYLTRAKLTMDNIAKVLYLGDKYNVTECMDTCTKFLRRTITENNVCWCYALAVLHHQDDLIRYCELMIAENTKAVFSSTSFLECSKEVLGHILGMDSLSCSEVEVFKAIIEWVKKASGENELTREIVQTHLGELFFKIRYRSMTFENFAALDPLYGGLFTLDEYREIVQLNATTQVKSHTHA
ncbi:BTB/POZ domain-containing protein 3-like [Contarinia nasturtii]|uniref:BTB/POZ domain-containing protein 3-like n=1 Tax=Contarinia nasturtii TaxID=265458 RepID=UPI0012D4C048|nr:BTB/POZ domain-containing protein 3-like [Contarinia nasturtii]XP_031639437.1 BTB/POZ domain-containing protein 3-like [Contarinia nasturtii]